ncbi:MAG: rhodanese-related sulfurtransferase [Acaryochloridaceae cyanobacterium SU_2_1]|nr:rhodanese-related sulfurtransferase [Acaryochloridaceae cyanobacterium SU_2_1]NJM95182.1 rhodanese-related sulfurtransferase [Acaryochloridaceae cyanobacterium CSU_5_19]
MTNILIASFYKFVEITDPVALRADLLSCCEQRAVKGTLLLAREGVNGAISGPPDQVEAVFAYLRDDSRFADLSYQASFAENMPFYRLKVRLKQEIIRMGIPDLDPSQNAGQYVTPHQWNELLEDPEVIVIDARNDYEVALGHFTGAVNPQTKSFSELPQWLASQTSLRHQPKVAMYCTGGIRCEKSTAFLRSQGLEEVYHLQGGILNYLNTVAAAESHWQGECFVFDERVSVVHGLEQGHYDLCRACRNPISSADQQSDLFVLGVSCPHCYGSKTPQQSQRLLERQHQIELARSRNQPHIGARYSHRPQ